MVKIKVNISEQCPNCGEEIDISDIYNQWKKLNEANKKLKTKIKELEAKILANIHNDYADESKQRFHDAAEKAKRLCR